MKFDLRKIYRFEPVPHNADADCMDIVSSVSHLKTACACGNLKGGGGSIEVRSAERTIPLKGKLR